MSTERSTERSTVRPQSASIDDHDHEQCIANAIRDAERVCTGNGVRLTTNRRKVLEILWGSHDVMGAYEILQTLQQSEPNTKPPTVYRALEFLLEQGLVHRIESSNAFTRCESPLEHATCQFLVCTECARVEELHSTELTELLGRRARDQGFEPTQHTIEVRGRCRRCQAN